MLFDNNPMSLVCSLVCNHENQCEGHCVLGRKGQPVHISSIENYISDTYFERIKIECQPRNGRKVAVIGAGPAGITIAILLTKKGYSVTIFDSREKIGGVLSVRNPGFPPAKDGAGAVQEEAGIHRHSDPPQHHHRRAPLEIKDLFRDGYESIFIGNGRVAPKDPGGQGRIPGQRPLRHRLSGESGCV